MSKKKKLRSLSKCIISFALTLAMVFTLMPVTNVSAATPMDPETLGENQVVVNGIVYELDETEKTAEIIGYTNEMPKSVNVSTIAPESHPGIEFDVTSVKSNAFDGGITTNTDSLNFPKVTSVGERAFYGCRTCTLKTGKLESMGKYAFANSEILQIYIDGNITSIPEGAFLGAYVGNYDFSDVTFVGASAFKSTHLTEIDLSDATLIESEAFGYCNLKKVSIGRADCVVAADAFSGVGESNPASLILPKDWPSTDLPDEAGNWHGGKFCTHDNWNYTGSSYIYAICDDCDFGRNQEVSLTLTNPSKEYSGSPVSLDASDFTWSIEFDNLDTPEIGDWYINERTKTTAANSGATSEGGAPVNIGDYLVEVTIGERTYKYPFKITHSPESLLAKLEGKVYFDTTNNVLMKYSDGDGASISSIEEWCSFGDDESMLLVPAENGYDYSIKDLLGEGDFYRLDIKLEDDEISRVRFTSNFDSYDYTLTLVDDSALISLEDFKAMLKSEYKGSMDYETALYEMTFNSEGFFLNDENMFSVEACTPFVKIDTGKIAFSGGEMPLLIAEYDNNTITKLIYAGIDLICSNHSFVASNEDSSKHICSICGLTEVHTFTEYISDGNATCAENGTKTRKCEICGYEDTVEDENSATGKHSYKNAVTKATLTTNGKIETKCSVCGDVSSTKIIYSAKTVKLDKVAYTYDGKTKKPSVVIKDSKGKEIPALNYTVTYPTASKKVGEYTVKVTFKGNYKGSKSLTFKINPVKTAISSLTAGSKSFTVKWAKKTAEVTGYQIQYSTSDKFKTGNKTVTITKNGIVKKQIKSLKAGKKYFVRVRTYKTVGKVKFYSEWSAKKSVTTKK